MQILIDGFLRHAPTVAFLLIIFIAGVLLARAIAKMARWAVERTGLEAFAERLGVSRLLYAVGIHAGLGQVIETLARWTVLLITLVVAAEVAGLEGVSAAIRQVIAYLPQVVVAAVILIAGARVAEWVRTLLLASDRARGGLFNAPQSVARVAYYTVIIISFTLAADQLGLEITLINSLIQVAFAAMLFGLALALALSARPSLSGVIARFYAAQVYKPGDRVRIANAQVEGVVLRFAATAMVVQTEAGEELLVPCGQILDSVVRLDRRAAHDERDELADDDVPAEQPE